MNEISMAGVGGAFPVTMHGKAGGDYEIGMALTLTGPNEVGFGIAAGSPVFGIVTQVEIDHAKNILLGVQASGFYEGAKMANGANSAAVGEQAYCNASGQIMKMPADPTGKARGIITAVDTVALTATVSF